MHSISSFAVKYLFIFTIFTSRVVDNCVFSMEEQDKQDKQEKQVDKKPIRQYSRKRKANSEGLILKSSPTFKEDKPEAAKENKESELSQKRVKKEKGSGDLKEKRKQIDGFELKKFSSLYEELIGEKFREDQTSVKEFLGQEGEAGTIPITPLINELMAKDVDTRVLVNKDDPLEVIGVLSLQRNQDLIGKILDLPEIFNKLGIHEKEQEPFVASLSVIIFREYRGQQLAKKACEVILEALRAEKKVGLVTWHTLSSNISSVKTAVSCGFQEVEGVTRKAEKLFVKVLGN